MLLNFVTSSLEKEEDARTVKGWNNNSEECLDISMLLLRAAIRNVVAIFMLLFFI
jgi:hypothetical protein